jgi:hypothetical protein
MARGDAVGHGDTLAALNEGQDFGAAHTDGIDKLHNNKTLLGVKTLLGRDLKVDLPWH